ncbi:hypothetical protein EDD18DRAFT_851365 [Armillaria luteobubalina]|uniref:Secreted protein n=1 Tax=Armillaria luteobubalina TaxID=153913 RepID=A0AA39QAT9_9AGAR|nr:hypothetical protein EDD18DRAFT_851365 [Armillaria luteobubalina]
MVSFMKMLMSFILVFGESQANPSLAKYAATASEIFLFMTATFSGRQKASFQNRRGNGGACIRVGYIHGCRIGSWLGPVLHSQ